jgi:hypothetical protein
MDRSNSGPNVKPENPAPGTIVHGDFLPGYPANHAMACLVQGNAPIIDRRTGRVTVRVGVRK